MKPLRVQGSAMAAPPRQIPEQVKQQRGRRARHRPPFRDPVRAGAALGRRSAVARGNRLRARLDETQSWSRFPERHAGLREFRRRAAAIRSRGGRAVPCKGGSAREAAESLARKETAGCARPSVSREQQAFGDRFRPIRCSSRRQGGQGQGGPVRPGPRAEGGRALAAGPAPAGPRAAGADRRPSLWGSGAPPRAPRSTRRPAAGGSLQRGGTPCRWPPTNRRTRGKGDSARHSSGAAETPAPCRPMLLPSLPAGTGRDRTPVRMERPMRGRAG